MQTVNIRLTPAMCRAIDHVTRQDGGTFSSSLRSLLQQALQARGIPPYGTEPLVGAMPAPAPDTEPSTAQD